MLANLFIDTEQPLVWTIGDVLSAEECAAVIDRMSGVGYEEAPINTSRGPRIVRDHRNNTRAVFDDPKYAALLFERVRHRLPERIFEWRLLGLNERFRGYRYEPGQYFARHYDGAFKRHSKERSFITFMVYLNEGFGGGETAFRHGKPTIVPRTGQVLCFQHKLLHEGCPVTSGTKYVLRSDVMYRKLG